MSLPLQQTNISDLSLLQTKWKSQIDPVLAAPLVNGNLLKNVHLISGTNSINHQLGEKLQGYMITRRRQWLSGSTPTAYDIYDVQDSNQMPQLTLQLTCSQGTAVNPVLVDIFVF